MHSTSNRPHTVVTGGAGGIGAATIDQLLERGHHVSCFDFTDHPDERVHSEAVDVTDESAVEAAVERASAVHGKITGLAACHGIRGSFVPALDMDLDQVRKHYDIHVVGTLSISRQITQRLEGAPASMVFISSTTAYGGWVRQADYGPAKAAERQLMENLAIEWAPLNVRVNAIAPGHTMTPMVRDLVEKENYDLSETKARMPLGRLAEPSEMADAITWLLCDATFVTGQCLPVDGGWTTVGK